MYISLVCNISESTERRERLHSPTLCLRRILSCYCAQSLEFKRVDVEDLTLDYIRGEVALPPRGRDQGRPFAWNQHVLGWWQKLKSDEYTGVVVDFDQAISEAAAAVEKLIALCRPQDLGDPYKALAVLQQVRVGATASHWKWACMYACIHHKLLCHFAELYC